MRGHTTSGEGRPGTCRVLACKLQIIERYVIAVYELFMWRLADTSFSTYAEFCFGCGRCGSMSIQYKCRKWIEGCLPTGPLRGQTLHLWDAQGTFVMPFSGIMAELFKVLKRSGVASGEVECIISIYCFDIFNIIEYLERLLYIICIIICIYIYYTYILW